jgi:adenylate kinase family enzyme
MPMKRVLVIGSSGAGKSTFARRLGEKTGLQVVHLDVLHWKPNWTEPSKDEWRKTVENALKADSWIMDGNYSGTMEMRIPACDTIIFLDFPRLLCVYRILKRVVMYRKGSRPDMAEGCHEKFDWTFIKWVWNYPERTRPKVEALLKKVEGEKTIIRLKSPAEVEDFFAHRFSDKVKSF